jgi:hypothetical protein
MGYTRRKTILILIAVFAVFGVIVLRFSLILRISPKPIPAKMPPVVDEPMESILRSLESELAMHRP